MGQKRDRTRTDSLGILAVPLATELKFYVFTNKMKEEYFISLCSLTHCFFFPLLHLPV